MTVSKISAHYITVWQSLSTRKPALYAALLIMAGSIPALLALYIIVTYAVNVPVGDEWKRVNLYATNALFNDLGAFWLPSKVHRNFFPALFTVGVFHLTAVNVLVVMYINWLINVANALIISHLYRVTTSSRSFLVFSLVSLPIFMLSIKLYWLITPLFHVFFCTLALVIGLYTISCAKQGWRPIIFTQLLAYIGAFSVFDGNFLWVLFPICMILNRYRETKYFAGWAIMALPGVIVQVNDVVTPGRMSTVSDQGSILLKLFVGLPNFLGAPLVPYANTPAATIVGLAGLLIAIILLIVIIRADPSNLARMAPWICLGLFGIFAAVITSLGRGVITDGSQPGRYFSRSNYFWVSILLITAFYYGRTTSHPTGHRNSWWLAAHLLPGISGALIVALYIVSNVMTIQSGYFPMMSTNFREAQNCVARMELENNECLSPLRSNEVLVSHISTFKERNVWFVRKQKHSSAR
jgi:hypothetical protein